MVTLKESTRIPCGIRRFCSSSFAMSRIGRNLWSLFSQLIASPPQKLYHILLCKAVSRQHSCQWWGGCAPLHQAIRNHSEASCRGCKPSKSERPHTSQWSAESRRSCGSSARTTNCTASRRESTRHVRNRVTTSSCLYADTRAPQKKIATLADSCFLDTPEISL